MKKIEYSDKFKSEFLIEARARISRRIARKLSSRNTPLYRKTRILLNARLDQILIGDSSALLRIARELRGLFGIHAPSKKYFKLIGEIFDFDEFKASPRTAFSAYAVLAQTGLRVCPYCDENFILHLNSSRRVRSPLDHFLPASRYPHFSVSLFNLIPSCGNCNLLKAAHDTLSRPILSPAQIDLDKAAEFRISFKSLANSRNPDPSEIIIKFAKSDPSLSEHKFERLKNLIQIEERYQNHRHAIRLLIDRCEIVENVLKPNLPGYYTNTILKNTFFNSGSTFYLPAPLGKLERDFLKDRLK